MEPPRSTGMTPTMEDDLHPDLVELDRLLNDPEVPMHPARVWEMADRVAAGAAHRPA